MGSGKSTLGRALAEVLHYDFVDTDMLIEQQSGQTIADFFSNEGEDKFRRYEQEIIHSLFGREKLVVACGGGLPCFFDNMEQLNAHGTTIYLKATPEFLAQRLEAQHMQHRPLLQEKTGEALRQHISQLLAQREQYYNRASIIIDASQDALLAVLMEQLSCR